MPTIEIAHPAPAPEAGVRVSAFSAGHDDIVGTIRDGFQIWLRTDAVALFGSLRDELEHCTSLNIDFPAMDSRPAFRRRVVFGPAAWWSGKAG